MNKDFEVGSVFRSSRGGYRISERGGGGGGESG